jgi:hypothetical protein
VPPLSGLHSSNRSVSRVPPHLYCTLILGDLNARHASWGDTTTARGSALAHFCSTLDLHILNSVLCHGAPTFPAGNSILDLAITSDPALVSSLSPDASLRLMSDHLPLVGSFTADRVPPGPARVVRRRWALADADWLSFEVELERVCCEWLSEQQAIDPSRMLASARAADLNTSLLDCFYRAAAVAIPRRPAARARRHWWCAMPGVQEALTAYHRAKRARDRHRDDPALQAAYSAARARWRTLQRPVREDQHQRRSQTPVVCPLLALPYLLYPPTWLPAPLFLAGVHHPPDCSLCLCVLVSGE